MHKRRFDDNFDEQEFLNFSKNIFIKYQKCIETKKIDDIKYFSTKIFFEKCKEEEKNRRIDFSKKYRKEIEFTGVKYVEIYSYYNEGRIINVKIKYSVNVYEYSVITGNIMKTEKNKIVTKFMQFLKFNEHRNKESLVSTKCVNCGAPTNIISIGKCPYCGEIIQNKELNWKLDDIK